MDGRTFSKYNMHNLICCSMRYGWSQLEGCSNNMPRPSAMTDREKGILSSGKAARQLKQKDQMLPAGCESWGKAKMTGRRCGMKSNVSVKAVGNRMLDADIDYKLGMQQRLSTESHMSESHACRSNIRSKIHAASPTKGKGSHAFVKSSSNVSQTSPIFDSQEQTSIPIRCQVTGGLNNSKCPFSTGSSKTLAIQWSKQKPPKHQRAKRKKLVYPVLNQDDLSNLMEGSSNPESLAKSDSTECRGQAALSECEESGATNKCKNKMRKQGDADRKIALRSGRRRRGRDSTPLRMNASLSGKLENLVTNKQLRSTRPDTDKVASLFSKTGQPPTKKTSLDRKLVTWSRCPMNNGLSDFTGDLNHTEELLSAVNASNNASDVACSGPFWKQMEPFFASLTQADLDFLKHQVREVENEDTILISSSSNQTGEADLICSMLPINSCPVILCNQRSLGNVCDDNESLKPSSNLNAKEDIKRSGNFRCFDRMIPLSQRLLSALIVEEYSEETNRKLHDEPQDDCLHCTSEDSPCSNCTQIENDSENAHDIQSEELDLDQRILLELQSIGLFTEAVPDISYREDEEIKMEICKLKDELQQQVSKNKHHLHKLEKAVCKRQKVEEREHGILAMNKLVESTYNRHMESQGTTVSGHKGAQNKFPKQASLGFTKWTLAKCRIFEETGKSCFSDAPLKERMFSIPSKEMDKKILGGAVKDDTANVLTDNGNALTDMKTSANHIIHSEQSAHIVAQHGQELENGDWELCNIMQGTASCPVQTVVKDDVWSTHVKTSEFLLEEVNRSGILNGAAAFGTALSGGAKRKRTKRDREEKVQAKEIITRCGSSSSGRLDLGNFKGEMKIKLKARQRTTQLSAAANDLLSMPAEAKKPSLTSNHWEEPSDRMVKLKDEMPASQNSNADVNPFHDSIPIDLSHFQLPNSEDFDAWLNFDDDSLPDTDSDYIGLAVPMGDLANLNMF